MANYLIVADDFTGANDTGVQLVNHGIDVNVNFDVTSIDSDDNKSSCVLDTETRNSSTEEATNNMKSMMSKVNLDSFDIVLKKVDSTLRGNISAEIKTLAEFYDPDLVVFAPALPSLGRTIKNEILYVNKIRALDTEIGKDPLKPIDNDNISDILKRAFLGKKNRHYSIKDIRKDNFKIDGNYKYLSFDSENSMDLQKIIKEVKRANKKVLWVGSAGLMSSILMQYEKTLPAVGLIGSVSDVTRRQLHFAEENGVNLISIPIYDVYEKDSYASYLNEARELLQKGKDVVVMSSASYDRSELNRTIKKLEKYDLSKESIGKVTQTILAGICRRLVLYEKISGVFVTGGDTAKGLLDVGKAGGVQVIDEIEPGIPMLKIRSGDLNGLNIVTKAGAFGNDELITYAFKKLRSKSF